MMRQVEMLAKILFEFECKLDIWRMCAMTVTGMGSIGSDVANSAIVKDW